MNFIKPLDLTMNSWKHGGAEELVKSQHHKNVDRGTNYMKKEPGSLTNKQKGQKKMKKELLY